MHLESQKAVVPLIRVILQERSYGAADDPDSPVGRIIAGVQRSEGEGGVGHLAVGTAAVAGAVTEEWATARGIPVAGFLDNLPTYAPDFAGHIPDIMRAALAPDPERPFFVVMGDLVREGKVGLLELITSLAEYAVALISDLEQDGTRSAEDCLKEAEDLLREWAARE
jgi:hypothetical protein